MLSASDMIVYAKESKESTHTRLHTRLELFMEFSKTAGFKIDIQKSMVQ